MKKNQVEIGAVFETLIDKRVVFMVSDGICYYVNFEDGAYFYNPTHARAVSETQMLKYKEVAKLSEAEVQSLRADIIKIETAHRQAFELAGALLNSGKYPKL
jgi:hypothetical protein